jgi:hypothetical protein
LDLQGKGEGKKTERIHEGESWLVELELQWDLRTGRSGDDLRESATLLVDHSCIQLSLPTVELPLPLACRIKKEEGAEVDADVGSGVGELSDDDING